MIDIRLRVFNSVATNMSFSKAAQELFISQPAISKHIQELEREYNCRLFDRLGNRIALTQAGQLLLEHSKVLAEQYRRLDFAMHDLRQHAQGELRLGASTTIAQYILPERIAHFRKAYPHIHLTLLSTNSRHVEAALMANRIDLGMVEGRVRQPQLKYTPFMNDTLVAFVSSHSPLSHRPMSSLQELCRIPIVLREFGSGTLDVIEQALRLHGIKLSDLNIEMNFGTTEGIKNYVAHTACMGIASREAVKRELDDGTFTLVTLPDTNINRQLMVVEKQGETGGPAHQFKLFITKDYSL